MHALSVLSDSDMAALYAGIVGFPVVVAGFRDGYQVTVPGATEEGRAAAHLIAHEALHLASLKPGVVAVSVDDRAGEAGYAVVVTVR